MFISHLAHSNSTLKKPLSSRSHTYKYIQDVRENTECMSIYRVSEYIQVVREYTECTRIYSMQQSPS